MPMHNHGIETFSNMIKNAIDKVICCRHSKHPKHSRFYESSEDVSKASRTSAFVIFDDKFADHYVFEDANRNWERKIASKRDDPSARTISVHEQKLPEVDASSVFEDPDAQVAKQQDRVDSIRNESGYGISLDGSRGSSVSSTLVVVGKESFCDSYTIKMQTRAKCWYVTRRKSEFITIADILHNKNYINSIANESEPLSVKMLHDFVKNLINDESAMKMPEVAQFLKLRWESTLTRPRERFCTVPESPEGDNLPDQQNHLGGNARDHITGMEDKSVNHIEKASFRKLNKTSNQISPTDFDFISVIGKGSFGKVILATKRDSDRIYAIKVINKQMILKRKEIGHVLSERSVLVKVLKHPYLVQLHYAFTTTNKIYFVLNYVNGGELFYHLQRERIFSEARSKFYSAEICCALSYMHSKGIVYRDLKPENILLDKDGHIVLTDFGLCKEGMVSATSTTRTFCGTPEYLAPEILLKRPYTRSVDWWTLGIVLYEMLYGLPPFYSRNTAIMYEDILTKPLRLRPTASLKARDLLRALLIKNPSKRLGSSSKDGLEIKTHNFFSDIKWNLVDRRQLKPPYVPNVTCDSDMSNIDPLFTRETMSSPEGGSLCMSATENDLDDVFEHFFYSQG